ncbi:MAG TPA: hypothetical protein VFQ85_12250 [Mycobacteriales bacterium]|nr:hypothetical protein [Mycobacteriales bacterium]
MRRLAALVAALALLAGCTHFRNAAADRVADWHADLAALLPALASVHPDLLRGGVPLPLGRDLRALDAEVATADDDHLMVGLMHAMTEVSFTGRDAHTGLYPWSPGNRPVRSLPLRWWFFPDGLYIEAQLGGDDLVGARVEAIAGHPLAEVVAKVDPLVPHDNESGRLAIRPRYLLVPEVLHGLDVIDRVGPVPLTVVDARGRRTVTVEPVPMARYAEWAGPYALDLVPRPGLRYRTERADVPLWHETLPGGVVYVAFNAVTDPDPGELAAIGRAVATASRVVVDLRNNTGGEVGADEPLLAVLTDERVLARAALFVLTGRNTFSAAALFAAKLDRKVPGAVFAGEAMAGAPTSYANARDVRMERTGFVLTVASSREAAVSANDRRETIPPDRVVAMTSRDYFAGRDPVLAAALTNAAGPRR